VTIAYQGPEPLYIRTITKDGAWPDDPDWLGDLTTDDPAEDICWGLSGKRAAGVGTPLQQLVVYFAAVDATGQQVAATATVRVFLLNKPEAYGLKAGAKDIRHPSMDALAGYDLIEPLVVTCTKHQRMAIRITGIASADATEVRMSIQEMQ